MNSRREVMENLVFADQYIQQLFPHIKELKLVVTGGASFLLKGYKNKFTLDIDTISELDAEVVDYLESFAINNSASEVTRLPKGYEERLVSLRTKKLNVLKIDVLSNEDLVLSKLGRSSSDDLTDILETGILDDTNMEQLYVLAESLLEEQPSFQAKWDYFLNVILGGMVA